MGGFTSVLHPEMTEAVRYWTGAQPARLQGTSGAVDVIPAQVGARPRVVAGVNLAWAHAFVETPTRSGGIALAARRSYLDGVMALVVGAEAAQIAPRFSDVQGRLQVGDASMTVLTLSDQFDAPSLDGGTLTVSQTGAQAQGRIPLDVGDGEVVISPWVARHGRALTGDVSEEQSLVELFPGLRVAWESNPRAELRFEGGVETEYRNWTLALGSRAFQLPGARADPWLQASTGREVVIDGGIRIDTLWVRDQLPRAAPSPRTSVQWEVSDRLTLHTEVGRFHAIPLVTLLAGLPEGAYLPLERSDLVSAGMQTTQQVWRFDANVYQRNLAHLSALEDDGSVGQLVGRARGLETQLAWQPERATVTLLYQYARTERREDRDSDPVPAITDQPHRLQLLGVTHLPRSLTLSSRFRYGSGFPRALDEETGLMEPQTAFDLLTQSYAPAAASVDAPRLRPFYSLDVKISRQVQLKHWRLDLWLDVQNVFNRRVAEPLITGFGESRPSYGVGLPILPIFGVEGVWWPSPRSDEASPRSRPASGD